jgi:hypothetical protein
MDVDGWMKKGLAKTYYMVWRPFTTNLETAGTIEGAAYDTCR